MDIANLDPKPLANSGVAMPLKHPSTGEPLFNDDGSKMWIKLAGADSDRYRAARHASLDRRVDEVELRRKTIKQREIQADGIALMAAATIGWDLTLGGKKLEFSEDAAVKLYTDFDWIARQVDGFVANIANFIPASSTT